MKIHLKSPKQVAKEIELRNRIFKQASPAQKCVLIAKDVIKQIRTRKLKPTAGHFYRVNRTQWHLEVPNSLQEALLSNAIPSCDVCGIGGLAVSCTLFRNKVGIRNRFDELGDTIYNQKPIEGGLHKVFKRDQLILIEQAFERGNGFFSINNSWFKRLNPTWTPNIAAIAFGKRYRKASERLQAIMRNIIKNKGRFIP